MGRVRANWGTSAGRLARLWRGWALVALVLLLIGCAGPGTQPTPTLGLNLSPTETPPPIAPAPSTSAQATNTRALTPTRVPTGTATARPATATSAPRPTSVASSPEASAIVLGNPNKLDRIGLRNKSVGLVAAGGANGRTIYAVYEGVVRSTDNGVTWDPMLTEKQVQGINSLVVAPSNPLIVYAGIAGPCTETTKRPSYKTADGGEFWYPMGENLRAITVDPKDPNTIYAINCDGLVKSTDAGTTWRTLPNSPLAAQQSGLITIAPSSPRNLYLGVVTGPGNLTIWRSTDSATTWTAVTPKIAPNTPTNAPLPGAAGNVAETMPIALAIDAANPAIVLLSTSAGVFRTDDSGAEWVLITDGLEDSAVEAGVKGWTTTALVADPARGGTFWVGTGTSGLEGVGIFRSRDKGETWRRPLIGLNGKRLYSIAIGGTAAERIIYVSSDDGVWALRVT